MDDGRESEAGGRWVADPAVEARLFDDGSPTILLDSDAFASEMAGEVVSLTLQDLLPDDAGEVVLYAGDDGPINLLASETVTAAGIAPEHVTAGGLEVTGLHYYSFESGLTVYSPVDLLIIDDPNAG